MTCGTNRICKSRVSIIIIKHRICSRTHESPLIRSSTSPPSNDHYEALKHRPDQSLTKPKPKLSCHKSRNKLWFDLPIMPENLFNLIPNFEQEHRRWYIYISSFLFVLFTDFNLLHVSTCTLTLIFRWIFEWINLTSSKSNVCLFWSLYGLDVSY